jgi:hypothetical protein
MQDQDITSEQRLEKAKERLKDSLLRLDELIQKQNKAVKSGQKLQTEVIKDLDKHIETLGKILEPII